jgi:hypothetical protein
MYKFLPIPMDNSNIYHIKTFSNMLLIYMAESCKLDDMSYMNNLLIILEHDIGTSKGGNNTTYKRQSPESFFKENKVLHLIAVKCTFKKGQVYVASGLGMKFHFSAPVILICSLVDAIHVGNNHDVEFIFCPPICKCVHDRWYHSGHKQR